MIIDKILDDEYDNDMYHNIMDEVIKFINLHYLNGSDFDTPFWQMAKVKVQKNFMRGSIPLNIIGITY